MTLRNIKEVVLLGVDKSLDEAEVGRVKCNVLISGVTYQRRHIETKIVWLKFFNIRHSNSEGTQMEMSKMWLETAVKIRHMQN